MRVRPSQQAAYTEFWTCRCPLSDSRGELVWCTVQFPTSHHTQPDSSQNQAQQRSRERHLRTYVHRGPSKGPVAHSRVDAKILARLAFRRMRLVCQICFFSSSRKQYPAFRLGAIIHHCVDYFRVLCDSCRGREHMPLLRTHERRGQAPLFSNASCSPLPSPSCTLPDCPRSQTARNASCQTERPCIQYIHDSVG